MRNKVDRAWKRNTKRGADKSFVCRRETARHFVAFRNLVQLILLASRRFQNVTFWNRSSRCRICI